MICHTFAICFELFCRHVHHLILCQSLGQRITEENTLVRARGGTRTQLAPLCQCLLLPSLSHSVSVWDSQTCRWIIAFSSSGYAHQSPGDSQQAAADGEPLPTTCVSHHLRVMQPAEDFPAESFPLRSPYSSSSLSFSFPRAPNSHSPPIQSFTR